MEVIKLVEPWSITQARGLIHDSLAYHGEEAILLRMYHPDDHDDAPRCPYCSDDVYLEGQSDCTICYGSSFQGGVRQALRVHTMFSDNVDDEKYGPRGTWGLDDREMQTEAFPMLTEHDYVIRVRRWNSDHSPAELEGVYGIQAVTRDSLRTGTKFGQSAFDVIGQRAMVTELSSKVIINKYPVLNVVVPQATPDGVEIPVMVSQPGGTSGGTSSTGSQAFTFTQVIPITPWVIRHLFDHYPSVTVIVDDELVDADISYPDPHTVIVTFADPQAGRAVLE